eukprot:jgi/Ulvmu1/1216/UM109_0014.1
MDPEIRKRLFAAISLLFIFMQFPFAELPAPPSLSADGTQSKVPMSILQVAVASFVEGKRVPPGILKLALLPGLVVHDTWRAVDCKMGSEVACNEPVAMDQYDDVFSLKTPLCDPVAIRKIVKRNFEGNAELVTAGATLVLGAALMSVIYPIKFGFFGLMMILYAMVKSSVMPFLPGLMFIPVFAVATDIASMFRRNPRAVAARGIPPAEDRDNSAKNR